MKFKQKLQILSDMYDDKYSYLYIPKEFFAIPFNEMETLLKCMKINGCGPEGLAEKLIPEVYFGVIFTPACFVHNFMYGKLYHKMIGKKKSPELKANADRIALGNFTQCVIEYRGTAWLPNVVEKRLFKKRLFCAKAGYQFLKWFGGPAYFKDK